MSHRLRFFIAFLGGTAMAAFLTHYVAERRLRWWLHALLIGGFFGALTALAMRFTTLDGELKTVEKVIEQEETG